MRGDRPYCWLAKQKGKRATPHARGSTPPFERYAIFPSGYPACAGIDPRSQSQFQRYLRLPRMRGDRPNRTSGNALLIEATPHARGSTFTVTEKIVKINGYPACAGIDRRISTTSVSPSGLPRMRGDRPQYLSLLHLIVLATPHARGSTRLKPWLK